MPRRSPFTCSARTMNGAAVRGPRSAVVSLEAEMAVRAVTHESALQLRVEPPPPPPRPHDHPRRDLALLGRDAIGRDLRDRARLARLRAACDGMAEEKRV